MSSSNATIVDFVGFSPVETPLPVLLRPRVRLERKDVVDIEELTCLGAKLLVHFQKGKIADGVESDLRR